MKKQIRTTLVPSWTEEFLVVLVVLSSVIAIVPPLARSQVVNSTQTPSKSPSCTGTRSTR